MANSIHVHRHFLVGLRRRRSKYGQSYRELNYTKDEEIGYEGHDKPYENFWASQDRRNNTSWLSFFVLCFVLPVFVIRLLLFTLSVYFLAVVELGKCICRMAAVLMNPVVVFIKD